MRAFEHFDAFDIDEAQVGLGAGIADPRLIEHDRDGGGGLTVERAVGDALEEQAVLAGAGAGHRHAGKGGGDGGGVALGGAGAHCVRAQDVEGHRYRGEG